MFGRQKVATVVAEFLGAGLLTLLILSVQRSTIGVPFFVASAAGLTLTLLILAIGAKSGGFFNPAITIGLWTVRRISTTSAVVCVAAQLLGGWLAYYLYTYFVNSHLQPVGGHFTWRILIAEGVGTAVFAFGLAAALYQRLSVGAAAATTGLAYMLGIVAASSAAIGLLNPSVALGVRAWVWTTYVLGPVVGAVVGTNLYAMLFADAGTANIFTALSGASVSTTSAKPAAKTKKSKK